MKENIEDIDSRLEFIDLTDSGKVGSVKNNVLTIPLLVSVKGPSEASRQTYSYVKEIVAIYDIDIRQTLEEM